MKDRLLPFLLYRKVRLNYVLPYAFLFLITVFVAGITVGLSQPKVAEATTPKIIYYQGKISKTSDGTNIANGNYSMRFKLYTTLGSGTPPTGGSLLWTETWDGGTSQVAFVNGMFSVALGTYTSLSTVDFTTGALYLSVDFNPGAGYDGEMAPRQQLTAAPFAISANGVSGDGVINTTLQSATALTVANAGANYALQVDTNTASSVTGLKVTSAASGGGIALATISSATDEAMTINAKGAGSISIGTAAGSTGDILFGGGSGSTGCTVTNSTGAFACTAGGSFTTLALTGAVTGAASYNGLVVTANTGVVTTGTWNGTAVDVGHGGTGVGTLALNGILYGNNTGNIQALAVNAGATQCLTQASSAAPVWGSCGAGGATLNGISAATGNGTAQNSGSFTAEWDWNSLTSQRGLTLGGGTNAGLTSGGILAVGANTMDYAHTASETGSLATITFRDTTTGAFTTTSNGLLISPTVNAASGAATRTINGLSVTPSFTSCAVGTCSVNGVSVGNVTDGTGFTGTGLAIGTGWDSGFNIQSGGNMIKASSVNAFQILNSSGISIDNINTAAGAGSANLIYNSSFEQNIHNWVAKGAPTGGTPAWDTTAANAKFGSGTLKFIGAAIGDGAQYNYPFAPSTQYSASFWAKTASGTATLRLDRQDNGSDVGGCSDSSVTTTWTQFTCTFTTGATINSSTSNLFIKQNAAGAPTVYLDGVTMTLGATPLSYSMPGNNIQVDADYSNITLNAGQDADIQPWQLNSTPLPSGRRAATTITANGFAYYIGGNPNGAPVTTVNYSRMNADGSLTAGSWAAAPNSLPVGIYGHSSFVANGYLYVIGGCTDSSATAACTTPVATIYYSKLNSDGTVGTWQTNANSLPAARGFGAAVFSNGFVYFLGGYNATAQTAVYSARLSADGSISAWTTVSVTALGTGRYGHTTMNVNGKIYSIGGCSDAGALCNTAINTVEYATPANDGTLGAWTAASSLPTATGFHTTGILNGYLFNTGGRQASAAVATVYYAKVNSVGPLGIWNTSSNPLPAARQQSVGLYVNTYLYTMGGYDGTTLATSSFFASGARVSIFGGLDLVGLTAQTLTDYSGGGTLTAGNTRVVGDLRIDGFADLNNGLTVDSAINLNAVSASAGQNIFNINNLNSNSIFNVRHMSTNFGSLVTAGAFMQKNSYWGEEFNNGKLTACAPVGAAAGASINAWARGDGGGQGTAAACSGTANATVNGGELNASTATGGTTTFGSCSFASPGVTTANGVERITATSVNTVGSTANCVENLGGTTTTSNKIYLAANLPVITMKVKPSTLPAATAGARVQIGLMSGDSASGSGVNSPTQAIYFTNCSTWNNAAVPTGCSNTTWYGVTSTTGAGAATVVTCTVGSGSLTTAFSYLRIEVRSSTDVHFFADYNTTDGINESECGTGSATNITASALTPWMQAMYNAQAAATTALDIDYFRGWQDDNVTPGQDSAEQTPPVTLDPALATSSDQQAGFDARALLAKFMAMTEPESLEAQTQKIDTGVLTASSQIVSPTITANGLHVDSVTAIGDFITFQSDVSFIGRPYFNTDMAGFAKVSAGDNQVVVKFDSPYLEQPIVNVGLSQDASVLYKTETDPDKIKQMQAAQEQSAQELFNAGIQFLVINKNENGFTILLNKPAPQDIEFNWVALAVKGAKIALSAHNSTPSMTQDSSPNSGTVAGYSTGPDASTLVPQSSTNSITTEAPSQDSNSQPEPTPPADTAPISSTDLSQ